MDARLSHLWTPAQPVPLNAVHVPGRGGRPEDLSEAVQREFERDLSRERVKSGLKTAKAKGKVLDRRVAHRPSDRKAMKVIEMLENGLSYRLNRAQS